MKSSSIVKKKQTKYVIVAGVLGIHVFIKVTMNEKKKIIMNSFCNRYMCDGYTNMFYQCYYIDMIWKNQKLIFFCR